MKKPLTKTERRNAQIKDIFVTGLAILNEDILPRKKVALLKMAFKTALVNEWLFPKPKPRKKRA
jgi:hypothetical protein